MVSGVNTLEKCLQATLAASLNVSPLIPLSFPILLPNTSSSPPTYLVNHFFASARLKIEIKNRFGRLVIPQEWFCVPFERIEEAIERIKDKSIQSYKYDVKEARLMKVKEAL